MQFRMNAEIGQSEVVGEMGKGRGGGIIMCVRRSCNDVDDASNQKFL